MISEKSPPQMRLAHQEGLVAVTVIFMLTAALVTAARVLPVTAVFSSMDTVAGTVSS